MNIRWGLMEPLHERFLKLIFVVNFNLANDTLVLNFVLIIFLVC